MQNPMYTNLYMYIQWRSQNFFLGGGANLWSPPNQGPNIVGGSGGGPPTLGIFSKIKLNFIQKYNIFQKNYDISKY